ncbi:glycosyl/glycerophosphate transferase, teichoic acid biosynthesis [Marinitoga piezophila KA3]|uniref:Glycosyl/glycerophosphate transferase, teichoic acid biosynthesis n=1 Tax=Marinitoga piezophila (strain DSM 14283 / JCM 11233 / KA3) TaxID=443254 RepID=H2J7V8_MARPK|nr:CDP-glycerol glycerophosphotransferase family protein [Marinitoga piezophila]AEX85449.1 glycosyl/glycerophosphate transferase, teichoic acid biosynthesis [Marinitoga piezophila KA3]
MALKKFFEKNEFSKVIDLFNSKNHKTEEDYIITALSYFNLNQTNKAISLLKEILRENPDNLDALFNLTTIYYKIKNWNKVKEFGLKYYEKDNNDWAINDMLAELWLFEGDFDKSLFHLENAFNAAPSEMSAYFKNRISIFKEKINKVKKLPKLAFICAKGLDNFINDIIDGLSENYWVRKFVVTTDKEIYSAIDWADIIWFEWANEVAIIGSNYQNTSTKPAIVRLHSYESLAYYPQKINWNNIDKLILVAEHIKDIIKMYMPNIENLVDIEVINNGIDIEKIKFTPHKKGFNIAWVAHISYKKNPPMMLQIIKKLVEKDNRYKLHIAGDFQDLRYEIYLKHMVREMNLENNVIFYGWVDDMDEWWEDKNYLLSTSIHESFGYNIAEALAKGIKPIIHNFYGSKNLWPENFIFNTINEAVDMILSNDYDSEKYRKFIEKYSLDKQIDEIKKIIKIQTAKQSSNNYYLKKEILTLYYKSFSGSNTISLYKLNSWKIKEKYDIKLYKLTANFFKKKEILKSKMIITTHGPIFKNNNIINLELWHGFPLKAMGLMDNNEKNKIKVKKIFSNTDYIISYSNMYSMLMSACTGIPKEKFFITGMPRNDFLFLSSGKNNISKFYNVLDKKIIFFMPTFRFGFNRVEGKKNFNNIFGFEHFDYEVFFEFLKQNNILFIAKLHPNEENKINININNENFKLLRDRDLEKNNMDLYELINGVDLLITDYSSIYFDYLLLNKPIIFTPVDLEEYKKTRGLLLDPYDYWTPGEKALTQKELQKYILKAFNNDEYSEKRNEIKNIIHYYQDEKSSQRVWNLIDELIGRKKIF